MGFESMRAYLAEVEKKGLLQKIEGANWKIEIGAITEVVAFSPTPRVLLFDNIQAILPDSASQRTSTRRGDSRQLPWACLTMSRLWN